MSQTCANCGGPDNGNDVICAFCGQAYSPELAAAAVQCPQCRTPNRAGKQHCSRCNAWLVMGCLFCGAASPCNAPQCTQCGEAFQGMAERKAARDRETQTKSVIDGVVSVVGALTGHPTQPSQPQPQQRSTPLQNAYAQTSGYDAPSDPNAPKMPSH